MGRPPNQRAVTCITEEHKERRLTRALFQNGLEVYPEVTAFHPRAVVRNNDGKAWYKTRVGHLLSLPPILKMGLMVVLIAVFVDVKETRGPFFSSSL